MEARPQSSHYRQERERERYRCKSKPTGSSAPMGAPEEGRHLKKEDTVSVSEVCANWLAAAEIACSDASSAEAQPDFKSTPCLSDCTGPLVSVVTTHTVVSVSANITRCLQLTGGRPI